MSHLDDGVLRRMLDEPLAVSDVARAHLDTCPRCRVRRERIGADAARAAQLLAVGAPPVSATAALRAVHTRIAAEGIEPYAKRSRVPWSFPVRRRIRTPFAGMAAVLALVMALVWTPAGSLAQSFISLFQPTHVVAVQTTSNELKSLRGLAKYGTFHPAGRAKPTTADNLDDAAALSGMTVLAPAPGTSDIPAGTPTYRVQPSISASFTFSQQKAQTAAAANHESIPPMPANIDGSTLQVTIGTTVVTQYGGSPTGGSAIPGLVIAQMRAPSVTSTRVPVDRLESYILSLPEVPAQLASQIRAITDPSSTLPIPIPVDLVNTHTVDVQGVKGLEVGDNTGLGSGILWEKDGIIYAVGGPLTDSQVLTIANSLR